MASCGGGQEELGTTAQSQTSSAFATYDTPRSATIPARSRKVPVFLKDPPISDQLPVLPPKPDAYCEDASSSLRDRPPATLPDQAQVHSPSAVVENDSSSKQLSLQSKQKSVQTTRTKSDPSVLFSNNTRTYDRPTKRFSEASAHTTSIPVQRCTTASAFTVHAREATDGVTPPQAPPNHYLVPVSHSKREPLYDVVGDQTPAEDLRRQLDELQLSHSQLQLRVADIQQALSGLVVNL